MELMAQTLIIGTGITCYCEGVDDHDMMTTALEMVNSVS